MPPPVNGNLLGGRYELAGTLGIGGMAEVRRGWDTVLRRPVAVKLFHPGNEDVEAGKRFDNEARALALLSHPNLVPVYDAGKDGRAAFVVLRLVEGRTLRERLAEGPLTVAEARTLGALLADALAHVHERGVVHRDVKPSNVLLDDEGTPYLADFGLAQLAGATRFTRTDQMVGTAAYLAPEQVRGGEIGPATDIYSFGLMLLECLTGRREYPGGDIEAALARLHRPPAVPDDLPADLVRLLSLATSLSARRRPSAPDFARALRTGEAPTVATPRTRRPAPKAALAASAAGLLGAVGIAWAVLPGTGPANSAPGETSSQVVTQSPASTSTSTGAPDPTDARTSTGVLPPVEQVTAPAVVAPQPHPAGGNPEPPGHGEGKGKGSENKGKGKGKP
ncbi:protein kinase [Saccharothrix sp. HUAS TT1]|uniref:serine/threonine-protein kinase n=1 Tax=unclassified Saccharothrix TaxID=2593673 RepID=UPI00345C600A